MALHHMPIPHILCLRFLCLAALHAAIAARMEFAALRRICRGRNASLQYDAVALQVRIRHRNRRKQCLRVRVKRVCKNVRSLSGLYKSPQIHDSDRVGNMLHDG